MANFKNIHALWNAYVVNIVFCFFFKKQEEIIKFQFNSIQLGIP